MQYIRVYDKQAFTGKKSKKADQTTSKYKAKKTTNIFEPVLSYYEPIHSLCLIYSLTTISHQEFVNHGIIRKVNNVFKEELI